MIQELLKNYEQHYQFKLRLNVHHQLMYCGFDGLSQCELKQGSIFLECSQNDVGLVLKDIAIAIACMIEAQSEDWLYKALNDQLSELEFHQKKEALGTNQYILVMVSGKKEAASLQDLLVQLFEEHTDITIQDNHVFILMRIDEKSDWKTQLESIRSTAETELFVRIQMTVSSVFAELYEIRKHAEEVMQMHRLIQKYEPACLMALPEKTWLLQMAEALPETSSKQLLDVLNSELIRDLEDELILTAESFMENNLSISATARALYIHRNTLIYRLDKIAAGTGLDIRRFEDALKLRAVLLLLKK